MPTYVVVRFAKNILMRRAKEEEEAFGKVVSQVFGPLNAFDEDEGMAKSCFYGELAPS